MYVLGEHDAQLPVYLGSIIQNYIPHGYTSGGGGYVISKPAVSKIIDEGTNVHANCAKDGAIEDLDIGRYLCGTTKWSTEIYPKKVPVVTA